MRTQRVGAFMVIRWLTLASAIALTSGCSGTTDNRRTDGTVSFILQAGPRNAGQTGRGFLTARGDLTLINLTITGVPPWVVRPIQLFTFVYAGSCAKRGPTPAYALNETVQVTQQSGASVSGPFTLAKSVPVSMGAILSGEYAIVLRTSPADSNVDIFCGDMK